MDELAAQLQDISLRALLMEQNGALSGEQVSSLVRDGRLQPEQLESAIIYLRVEAEESALETARHMFLLGEGVCPPDLPDEEDFEDGLIEPAWEEFLGENCSEATATHLSLFFHTADAARYSGGFCFDDCVDEDLMAPDSLRSIFPATEALASWQAGEGQAELILVRRSQPYRSPPVPPFQGIALIRKAPQRVEPLDIACQQLEQHPIQDVLREQCENDQGALSVANLAGQLCNRGYPREALILLSHLRPLAHGSDLVLLDLNRATAWALLGHNDRAYKAAALGVEAHKEFGSAHVPDWFLHKNAAWYSYACQDFEASKKHADIARTLNADEPSIHAIIGGILFHAGELDEAAKSIEACMQAGVDPCLDLEITRTFMYRRLALAYGVPVELAPEELSSR